MKKFIKTIACLLLVFSLIIPVPAHAASLGISASTGTVKPGGSFTVYISSSGGIGRVNVYVSNGSASTGSVWVENSSASVTVTAGSSGYCTVTASPETGFSDTSGNQISLGSRSTSVAIKAASSGGSSSSSSSSSSSPSRPGRAETVDEDTGKTYGIAAIEKQTYTGKKIEPEVKVTCDGTTLAKDKDYTVKYENNINAGTAKVTVQGKGSHDFSLSGAFTIEAKDISKLKMPSIGEQRFTGKEIKPELEIKAGKTVLKEETDYTVKYENNVNVGTAIVTITGEGNYTGTATIEFGIVQTLFDPGCSSHWVILGIAAAAAVLLAVFRKKENIALAVMVAGIVINTIVAFVAGNCAGEWVMAYAGLILMVVVKWITSGAGKMLLSKIKQ